MNKRLAKISKATLDIKKKGILSFWIFVDYEDGGSQGVGGITLDDYDSESQERIGTAFGYEMIRRLLLELNVDCFSEMKGKIIWVLGEGQSFNFMPVGIKALNIDKPGHGVIFNEILKKFTDKKVVESDIVDDEKPEKQQSSHWPGMYKPEYGGTYYTLGAQGEIIKETDSPEAMIDFVRTICTCCKTEAEAEFVRDQKAAYLELVDTIKESNEGWMPDWSNGDEDKTFFTRKVYRDVLELNGTELFQTLKDELYMKTGSIAERVIKRLGEEKIKLALWPKWEEK